jgi:hypothetical protein
VRVSVERRHGGASLLDVLDRVLDKGIVLTPEVPRDRIDLRDEAVRIVGSIDTYLSYSEAVGQVAPSVPKLDDERWRARNGLGWRRLIRRHCQRTPENPTRSSPPSHRLTAARPLQVDRKLDIT